MTGMRSPTRSVSMHPWNLAASERQSERSIRIRQNFAAAPAKDVADLSSRVSRPQPAFFLARDNTDALRGRSSPLPRDKAETHKARQASTAIVAPKAVEVLEPPEKGLNT